MAVISPRRPAIFLDKDGTLLDNVPYNVDPDRMHLASGAAEALLTFHRAGYTLIVVSNQSGVARGYFDEQALRSVDQRLRELLAGVGVPLAGFYYCPHHPLGSNPRYAVNCDCRKPAPGMILRAAADHGIALDHSWLIGDILDDIEAGRRAGCQTVLLANGNETEWRLSPLRCPKYLAEGLDAARRIIIPRNCGAADRERRP
jgi:D-glycero-D-manno-heptose 1,7-bisphosphate phosphatase